MITITIDELKQAPMRWLEASAAEDINVISSGVSLGMITRPKAEHLADIPASSASWHEASDDEVSAASKDFMQKNKEAYEILSK